MRKLFLFELLYYWILHVLGPLIYYQIRGEYIYIYKQYCPPEYMNQAAIIISIPIIITFVLVAFMIPIGKDPIKSTIFRRVDYYFYIGCFFIILQQMRIGEYTNYDIINGTVWAYMGMFFDMGVLMLAIFITADEKVNIVMMAIFYMIATLSASSRQGALILVMALMAVLVATEKYAKQRKKILIAVLLICSLSPLGYLYATTQRGDPVGKGMELTDQIVGRCSNLEVLGDALYQKKENLWNSDVFERKYSIENQFKICVNSLVIGDVFEDDVYPNQYYRTIFQKVPEQQSRETYTSINLTLTGYLYLKYPLLISIIITVGILLMIYLIACLAKWPNYISIIILTKVTTSILDYFDWVMIVNDLVRFSLTLGAFYFIERIDKNYVPRIKKKVYISW